MKQLIILCDIDGVLADTEGYFLEQGLNYFKEDLNSQLNFRSKLITLQTYYNNESILSLEQQILLHKIFEEEDFFKNIPPITENIKAVIKWHQKGHKVIFWSSPISDKTNTNLTNYNCWSAKAYWIDKNIPEIGSKNLILMKEKILVQNIANIIIDDMVLNFGKEILNNKIIDKILIQSNRIQFIPKELKVVENLQEKNLKQIFWYKTLIQTNKQKRKQK